MPMTSPLLRHALATCCLLALSALPRQADAAETARNLPGTITSTRQEATSVYNHRVRPAEPRSRIDWKKRIDALLVEEPGDVILTAVGDMIFNEPITHLPDPERRQLLRLMQEADIAYGNMEFPINSKPELLKPFYNFRAPPEFVWEVARTGINLVSLANNHTLDFGQEGLREHLHVLDHSGISYAGAGDTLAEAHKPAVISPLHARTRFAMLSYMRFWHDRYRSRDPDAPSLATIDPAKVTLSRGPGQVESLEGLLTSDLTAMDDDIILAKRKNDKVVVALHVHDVSHARINGIQNQTPPTEEMLFRRAVDSGADMVLGHGPHVLRGIEIYKGKPILYSLSNFIYQYRTPEAIPVDIVHQRDSEMPRPTNVSVFDRRDSPEVMEAVMARMVVNDGRLKKLQLIPVTIDDEGPLYGVPKLANDRRGAEILATVQRLSAPYGTRIEIKGWYGEVVLPAESP